MFVFVFVFPWRVLKKDINFSDLTADVFDFEGRRALDVGLGGAGRQEEIEEDALCVVVFTISYQYFTKAYAPAIDHREPRSIPQ